MELRQCLFQWLGISNFLVTCTKSIQNMLFQDGIGPPKMLKFLRWMPSNYFSNLWSELYRKFNLTIDIWSKKDLTNSYLGVTAQFFFVNEVIRQGKKSEDSMNCRLRFGAYWIYKSPYRSSNCYWALKNYQDMGHKESTWICFIRKWSKRHKSFQRCTTYVEKRRTTVKWNQNCCLKCSSSSCY